MQLLTYPNRKPRTVLERFARLQIGTRVTVAGRNIANPGGGTIVEKSIDLSFWPDGRPSLFVWVNHAGGTGCFFVREIHTPAGYDHRCPARDVTKPTKN